MIYEYIDYGPIHANLIGPKKNGQGFECNRIMFSVYDRDETMGAIYGSQVDPLEEDEFLGRASVDISYLISTLVER